MTSGGAPRLEWIAWFEAGVVTSTRRYLLLCAWNQLCNDLTGVLINWEVRRMPPKTHMEDGDLIELAQRLGDADQPTPPDDWPMFIRTKVYYGPEDDHWYAIDADFDIASMGATADEALASLQGMLGAYLASHLREGRDLASARRPIPLALRIKLHALVLAARPMSVFRRGRGSAQEGHFLFPSVVAGR